MRKAIISGLAAFLGLTIYIDGVRRGAKPAPENSEAMTVADAFEAKP
jgi:hypothetical protein